MVEQRYGFLRRAARRVSSRPVRRAGAWLAPLAGLAFLLASPVAFAQETIEAPLTLNDALRLAIAHNPQLAAARAAVRQADGAVREARAPVYPRVDLSGSYLRIQDPPSLALLGQSVSLGRADALVADLDVAQTLYSGGGVAAGIRAASGARDAAAAAAQAAQERLALQVYRAFYGVLVARRLVEIRQASVDQLAAHLSATRARFGQGAATEYEVLRAEVELGNHRPLLVSARHGLQDARDRLTRLLGLDVSRPVDVTGELTVGPRNHVDVPPPGATGSGRPEVSAARAHEAAAAARVDVARAAGRPTLSWFAHLLVTSPEYLIARDATPQADVLAGVTVRVPLFTGFAQSGRTEQAAAALARARDARRNVEQDAALEVRQAQRALDEAEATLDAQAHVIEQAEKALAIARVRYTNGLGTELEVTDAQLALEQARVVRLEAVEHHVIARAARRRALGESLLPRGDRHEH